MSFSVNTNALPGLARSMDRRWQALQGGYDYLQRNATIGWVKEGILNLLCGEHQRVVDAVGAYLERAANGYAVPYSTAITAANLYYRRSDGDAAARLDASLVPSDDPGKHGPATRPANQALGAELFDDPPICQVDWYGPTHDYQGEDNLDFMPLDALSPTSDVRELIWEASKIAVALGLLDHPYDLVEEAVKPLSGDWTAFAACQEVFEHLGNALADQASCIRDGVRKIDQVWTGNAADACAAGLDRFAGDLSLATGTLYRTAAMYGTTTEQIRAEADVLASVVTMLADLIIDTGINAATEGYFLLFEEVNVAEDIARLILRARKAIALCMEIAGTFIENGRLTTADLGIIGNDQPMPGFTGDVPSLPHPARPPARAHATVD